MGCYYNGTNKQANQRTNKEREGRDEQKIKRIITTLAWRICAIPILCGVSNTSLIACRSSLTTSSCSELLSRTTGSCASGPRAPLLPLVCNQVKVSTSYFLFFLSPGQSDVMQSSTSTDSPTHVPMPLHPRALILDPVPQVAEH